MFLPRKVRTSEKSENDFELSTLQFTFNFCSKLFHFPQNIYHHYSSWLNFTLSVEGHNFHKTSSTGSLLVSCLSSSSSPEMILP